MNGPLLIPLLVTTIVGIVGWFIAHSLTLSRERQAEWRKEKLIHYKEYLAAYAGVIGNHAANEAHKRHVIAFNTMGLFASQEVIKHLYALHEKTKLPAGEVPLEEHNRFLTRLVFAMRHDLRLKPKDDERTFSFFMVARSEK